MEWLETARAERRRQGPREFWWAWSTGDAGLRAEAYRLGRFTGRARRLLDRLWILRVPDGVAWSAAAGVVYLIPRWLPRAGALPKTPWIGAVCLYPLPVIAGVRDALTPLVIAHEFSHVIYPRLPRRLRRAFPETLARVEAEQPPLAAWLDAAMEGYRDRRSPDECHVRLLEYFAWGRRPLPASLHPYYDGWVELEPEPAPG